MVWMKRGSPTRRAIRPRMAGWLLACAAALLVAPASAAAAQMTPYDVHVEDVSDYQTLPLPGGGPVVEGVLETDWDAFPVSGHSGAAPLVFPFPVRFFGTYYLEGAAASRGFLSFGPRAETICGGDAEGRRGTPATYPGCAINRDSITGPLPRQGYPNRLIAAWWSLENNCNNGAVRHQTVGDAPNRVFVIEWNGCGNGQGIADAQIWLREGSATIEVRYGLHSLPASGTTRAFVGVMTPAADGGPAEGYPGLFCTQTSCGSADFPAAKVITYSQRPDLSIEAVDTGSSVAFAGRPFLVSATVKNVGGAQAQPATVRYLISSKPTIDGSAVELAQAEDFHALAMDESVAFPTEVLLPADLEPGSYYLIAHADPTHAETLDPILANNVKASAPIVINPRMPYLSVQQVNPPAAIVPGSLFSLSWTIRNDGSAKIPDVPYAVVLSVDERISVADRLLFSHEFSVEAFSEESQTIDVQLPSDVLDGTYYVGLLIDPDQTLPAAALAVPAGASEPIVVSASELRVLTTSLPPAALGASYCLRLDAAGGGGRHVWSVSAGSTLPPGLHLDLLPAGAAEAGRPFATMLCGNPSTLGTFVFSLEVSAGTEVANADYELEVAAVFSPLQVATSELPAAAFMSVYDGRLRGAGGMPPYHWKLVGGALPSGLALRSDGGIVGAPIEDGRFPITVRLIDSEGRGVDRSLALLVNAPTKLTCGTRMLPAHGVGEPYALSLSAAGGTKPYRWRSLETRRLAVELGESAITLGSEPPPGLVLGNLGNVSGEPTQSGRYVWTVEVSDAASPAVEDLCTIVVDVAVERGLTVSTLGLMPATAEKRYQARLTAVGGEGVLVWTLPQGSRLPEGLSLTSDGTIEGFPELAQLESRSARDFAFVVEVRDSRNRRGLAALSIQVVAGPKAAPGRGGDGSGGGCSAASTGVGGIALLAALGLSLGVARRRR